MKRYIRSSRGHSSRVQGKTRELRNICDAIYDAVEEHQIVDWFANIKFAKDKYYIDYFRNSDGWFSEDYANDVASKIQYVINDLGYEDNTEIKLIKNSADYLENKYGYVCFTVRVIIFDSGNI